MKILMTGSSGYVGSTFLNLYQNNYDFKKYSLMNQKIQNINFNGIDVVLHCAALVHQKKSYSYKRYNEINVEYPVELARLAKENGVKQFIFMSTVAVYGEEYDVINEMTKCKPTTYYGISKLKAENQLLCLSDKDFIVSIIRSPMIYGQQAPGNIDKLIKVVSKFRLIPLGEIKNKRSFISIQNLCYAINKIICQRKGNVFLVADEQSISTSKLISLISKYLNRRVYLFRIPFLPKFIKIIKPLLYKKLYDSLEINNVRTRKSLKLQNPYTLEEGIRLMLIGEEK